MFPRVVACLMKDYNEKDRPVINIGNFTRHCKDSYVGENVIIQLDSANEGER